MSKTTLALALRAAIRLLELVLDALTATEPTDADLDAAFADADEAERKFKEAGK